MAKKSTPPQTKTPKAKDAKAESLASFYVETTGKPMTTDQGIPVEHTDDSLHGGLRGPTLLEDFHMREKIMRFDHERIPERAVHARGAGAHGYFEVYEPVTISRAKFLQDPKKKTPVFVRFSTVAGSRGSADTVRDVRGFATKFYTEEGNFDLVGNNIPVFFIQDGIKFPDLIHSVKPEPHNEIPQAASAHDSFWDFISLTPESMHMIMWHLSDRAIPRSLANMQGFGVHTFRMIDQKGKSRFVKFHWTPKAGACSLVWDEAQKIAGKDADFHRRGLFESIEEGNFPEWELGVQIVEEKDEMKFDFDLLDSTKLIPEELVPVKPIGRMVLNRNTDNYFAETEQVAYCIANVVPGIDVTNDPLLQSRLFSYLDTQLSRLGSPNFAEIPINRPLNPVANHQQDGHMRQGILKSRVNYFPNSLDGNSPHMTAEKDGGYVHYPQAVSGVKTRERSETFNDHFSQATLFYNSLSQIEKDHLCQAAQFELSKVEHEHIRTLMITHFMNVDVDLAKKIAAKIGVKATPPKNKVEAKKSKVKASPALSLMSYPAPDLGGRQVAILVADGFNMKEWTTLTDTLRRQKAKPFAVAPKLGEITSQEGQKITATKTLFNSSSVLFDSVYVLGGKKSVTALSGSNKAVDFVNEAFTHLKTIGFGEGSEAFLEKTIIDGKVEGVVANAKDFASEMSKHRHWSREPKVVD